MRKRPSGEKLDGRFAVCNGFDGPALFLAQLGLEFHDAPLDAVAQRRSGMCFHAGQCLTQFAQQLLLFRHIAFDRLIVGELSVVGAQD